MKASPLALFFLVTMASNLLALFGAINPLHAAQATLPFLSPTTTSALKLKRRPPLTTAAHRRIFTTRSSSGTLSIRFFFLLNQGTALIPHQSAFLNGGFLP